MNITSYIEGRKNLEIYNVKMSLNKDMHIVNAHETLYKLMGDNSTGRVDAIMHPEDVEAFRQAFNTADEKGQHLFTRVMGADGNYRYIYFIVKKSSRHYEGERLTDVIALDMSCLNVKYEKNHDSIVKYRKLMNYSSNVYFEYFCDQEIVNVFEYTNGRSIILYNNSIEQLYDEVNSDSRYSRRQRLEFEILYENLINKADNIDITIDGNMLGAGNCYLKLRGGVVYKEDRKKMVIAIGERVEYDKELKEQKYYMTSYAIDTATNVYNKRAISELAKDLIAEAAGKPLYCIIMDIDNFKHLNDVYGHMVGDDVLARVSEALKSVLGERGYVGRFGGDEFFIITDKIKKDEDVCFLLKTVSRHITWNCKDTISDTDVTTSIGVSKYPDNGSTYDELFRVADKCLYIAKSEGKNRYVLYNEEEHKDKHVTYIGRGDEAVLNDIYSLCNFTCRIMYDLCKNRKANLEENLRKIMDTFKLDGITLYTGEECKNVYSLGKYAKPREYAPYLRRENLDGYFDEEGIFCEDNVSVLKDTAPDAYEAYEDSNITGCLMAKWDDCIVSFDIFNRTVKWSENDKGLLAMLSKSIMEVFVGY